MGLTIERKWVKFWSTTFCRLCNVTRDLQERGGGAKNPQKSTRKMCQLQR